MDMIGKVRRMRLRDQLSLSAIAKRTGLSRHTVKKWLKAPGVVVPKYERVKLDGKLTAFEPAPHQALTTDSHLPKQGRRSGRALFAQIQAMGYRGGYSAVTAYIRRWGVEFAASPAKAFAINLVVQILIFHGLLHLIGPFRFYVAIRRTTDG
ncbi:hypothetical protein CLU89_3854 [Acidovorax sp. 30]|nr:MULTISPECIES: hypothetical protein [unclassified Acidovorax]PIF16797.1 hypothetical protein CLU87_0705 [Acidovorax sp. 59]PKW04177.1 hypothetical protein CLU89_3854 [Acidovorax sp. 30]